MGTLPCGPFMCSGLPHHMAVPKDETAAAAGLLRPRSSRGQHHFFYVLWSEKPQSRPRVKPGRGHSFRFLVEGMPATVCGSWPCTGAASEGSGVLGGRCVHPCFPDEVKAGSRKEPLGGGGGGCGSRVGTHDSLPAKVPMCVSSSRREAGTCGRRARRSWADARRLILSPRAGRSQAYARRASPGPPTAKVPFCRPLCP